MRNFRLFLFSYTTRTSMMKYMAGGASGSETLSESEATALAGKNGDNIIEAARLLDAIKDKPFDNKEFAKLDLLLEQISHENEGKKQQLFQLLEDALKDDSGFSRWDKEDLLDRKNRWENDYRGVKVTKLKDQEKIIVTRLEESKQIKKEVVAVKKRELLENNSVVREFAQHINFGSALELINAQDGKNAIQKLANAKKIVQDSKIAFSASAEDKNTNHIVGYIFSRSQITHTDNNQVYNQKRAIEASKLVDFIDTLSRDTKNREYLLAQNVPADRVLTKDAPLFDLIMDFDDDGVLESINSTDKSSMWKRLQGVLGFSTAMQGEFLGENQASNNMSEQKLSEVLKKYKIEQKGESNKDFAKRARSALLLRADMLRTTDMSADADNKIYKTSEYNKNDLEKTTKLVTALRIKITETIKWSTKSQTGISAEQVNNIANQMSSNILRWVTTMGIGSINMDTLLAKMGQAVVSGKEPGIESFLALDETVIIDLIKTETMKVSASAGAGIGVGSGRLVPFAHIGINGHLTAINNTDLEKLSNMKGNLTLGAGVNAGIGFEGGSIIPVPSLDIKWDDRIDTLENAIIRLGSYLDAATRVVDGKVKLDLSKVPKNIDPSLMDALQMLQSVIEEGGGNLSPDAKMAHAINMKVRFLKAFRLSLAADGKLGGFSLAGVKFLFLPGALGFGPTFQHIGVERKAQVVSQTEKKAVDTLDHSKTLAEYGLVLNGKTLLQWPTYDAKKVSLTDGLTWTNGSITLLGNEAFNMTGAIQKDSLAASSGVLVIGKKVAPPTTKTTPDAHISSMNESVILQEELNLSSTLTGMIDKLDIDKLIIQAESFMRVMTRSPINFDTAAKMMNKITVLKPILAQAILEDKRDGVIRLIDSLLVGDNITRGFNKAKTDKKFFEQYKKTLIAKAPPGLKSKLTKLTQESMTIGDIAFAFNRGELRNQELWRMDRELWLTGADQKTLRNADQKLIHDISDEKELKTIGHGYLLMVRNRRGPGLQGVIKVPNGGYLSKEEMTGLSAQKKIDIVRQMEKLNELTKKVLVAQFTNTPIAAELTKMPAADFVLGRDGKINIKLSGNRTLKLDMSASRISAALYGEVHSGKPNAVCLNVATLIEPVISGAIYGPKDEIIPGTVLNEINMMETTVGAPGEVRTGEVTIIGVIEKPKPKPPTETDNTPNKTDNTPNKTDNTPNKTDNTPNKTDNIPNKTDNTPNKTDNTPNKTDNTPSKINTTPGTGVGTAPVSVVTPVTGVITTPDAPATTTTNISAPNTTAPTNVDNTQPVDEAL